MGLFTRSSALFNAATEAPGGVDVGLASPWTDRSTLETIVVADLYGANVEVPPTRTEAMRVPAVNAARRFIVGTLSRLPLKAYADGVEVANQPAWLSRSDTGISPQTRMALIVDDLLFYDWSLLAVIRDADGNIQDARHVAKYAWRFEADNTITITDPATGKDAKPRPEDVVLIPGPGAGQGGLLKDGATTIRAYTNLERAWQDRVRAPIPLVELAQTEQNLDQTQEEINDLLTQWNDARSSGNAAAFTPYGIEVRVHGTAVTDLFIEGRNQAVLDISNLTGVPGPLLQATTATASLTYSTQEGHRNEWLDYGLSYWASAIEAQFSLDSVTPAGTYIQFDTKHLTVLPQIQGPVLHD